MSRGKTQKAVSSLSGKQATEFQKLIDRMLPFLNQLIDLGVSPSAFLQSPLGTALLAPARQAITTEFEQARQNLLGMTGGAGFGPTEGVAVGPFANIFSQEAQSQAQLMEQLPLKGLELAFQGLGALQGLLDPSEMVRAQAALAAASRGIGSRDVLGAVGAGLGGLLQGGVFGGGGGGQGGGTLPFPGAGVFNPLGIPTTPSGTPTTFPGFRP